MDCMRTGDAKRIAAKLDDPAGSSVHHWSNMLAFDTVFRSLFATACTKAVGETSGISAASCGTGQRLVEVRGAGVYAAAPL